VESRISSVQSGALRDVGYDRLVIATGSMFCLPPIPGCDKENVFPILKDIEHLLRLQRRLQSANDVVIIGGGFIGVEFADEIRKMGDKNVTIVEVLPHCLGLAYDDEFCTEMEEVLRSRGIKVCTDVKVEAIQGGDTVKSVVLSDGTEIGADVVIIAVGAAASADLAKNAGLRMVSSGAIAVDRTMMTSDKHIFACGDCAEKLSFFGGGPSPLKLASIATLEARIAGANLFELTRENIGTVGVWSTAVGDFALGAAGLTPIMASQRGYRVVSASVEGPNRHPGGMPGGAKTKVKLLFEANSAVLLGGQVRGNSTSGELVNVIGACIQKRMTADDLATFQMGTHPALTASPIAYPLLNAAEIAIGQIRRMA